MNKPARVCLAIAGSDPSGGAGIQADLKIFSLFRVHGCAVITCLTAQNSKGVSSFYPVDGSFVKEQIQLVLDDLPLKHVKIGMLGSSGVAKAVGDALQGFTGEIIYDPVLKASDGSELFQQDGLSSLLAGVVSRATVLTPNLPELRLLSGYNCQNGEEAVEAAMALLQRFLNLKAIVVTGGHFIPKGGKISDYLVYRPAHGRSPKVHKVTHRKIETDNSHGTGCAFSSAFAALHLRTGNYQTAFENAVQLMQQLLQVSSSCSGGMQHHLLSRREIDSRIP